MLSRIANNLFWMGSYIERVEHTARFTKVNYFSGLDAPTNISNDFTLNSLKRMNGIVDENLTSEEDVLHNIGFDSENSNSIISCVKAVRENARSARDILSTELWETINRHYHFTRNYDKDAFTKTNLYDFTQKIIEQISMVKGRIDSTLMHNEAWLVIGLGVYSERCTQILRIISTKLEDIKLMKQEHNSTAIQYYQIECMLRSLESFDMSRKFYRKSPNLSNSLEFLLFNNKFPRSVLSSAKKMRGHIERLARKERFPKDSAGYLSGKLSATLSYTSIDEIIDKKEDFVNKLQNEMYIIRSKIISDYLS